MVRPLDAMGEDRARGFVVRFAVLAVALLLVPWVVSMVVPRGPLGWAIPISAALILVVTSWRRPVEALLGLALLVLFYDTVAVHVGQRLKNVDEVAVATLAIVAFVRVAPRWREWVWWPREAALTVALLAGLASSLGAGVPLTVWAPALVLIVKPIAFLYTASWTRYRDWELRGAMVVVLAVAIVTLCLGFVELVVPTAFQRFFGLPEFSQGRTALPVVKSLLIHPALFGWLTAFTALFLFAQYLVTRQRRWLLLGLFLSTGPYVSARRRAILALLGSLVVGFVASIRSAASIPQQIRAWLPVAAGSLALVIVFLPALIGLYQLTVERYLPEPTASLEPGELPPGVDPPEDNPQARIALYNGSVEVARDHFPLGGGYGRWGSWMSRVSYSPLYEEYGVSDIRGLRPDNPQYVTDTFWPQILGEFGVIGFAAYAAFMASLAWRLWRESRRDDGPLMAVVRLGAGMVFTQAAVESLASSMYHSPPRVYLLFLAVGVVLSVAWRRRGEVPAAGAE